MRYVVEEGRILRAGKEKERDAIINWCTEKIVFFDHLCFFVLIEKFNMIVISSL